MFQEKSLKYLEEIKITLNREQQNLIQINSIKNFLLFFNQLHSEKEKNEVKELIDQYFKRIKEGDCIINRQFSNELGFKYVLKISPYYKRAFGFRYFNSSPLVPMIQGGILDFGLALFGVLEKIYFIPVVTIIILIRWLYLRIFYVPKNKVFGIRY